MGYRRVKYDFLFITSIIIDDHQDGHKQSDAIYKQAYSVDGLDVAI